LFVMYHFQRNRTVRRHVLATLYNLHFNNSKTLALFYDFV
jgi:hypothetical protein